MGLNEIDLLVADDDDQIVSMLEFLFERENLKLHIARDGRQVKEFVVDNSAPRLVILDVMMPYADGFELVELIRQTTGWESVPIMMLTGRSKEEDIIAGFEKGVSEYLGKPFQPAELVARVKNLLR